MSNSVIRTLTDLQLHTLIETHTRRLKRAQVDCNMHAAQLPMFAEKQEKKYELARRRLQANNRKLMSLYDEVERRAKIK